MKLHFITKAEAQPDSEIRTQPAKPTEEPYFITPNQFPIEPHVIENEQPDNNVEVVQFENINIKSERETEQEDDLGDDDLGDDDLKDDDFIDDDLKEESSVDVLFQVGEKIVYDITMWKNSNALGMINGSVSFEIKSGIFKEKDCYIFNGNAIGEGFGYKLELSSVTYVERKTLLPVEAINIQTGTENRKKKLLFSDDKIEYVKLKHCKNRDRCQIEEHFIETDDGTKEHCKKCRDRNHYIWRTRASLENVTPTYDLLSALFIARNFPVNVGKKSGEIRLADGRDLWIMSIFAESEEIVESKAGTFETIMLKLSTKPLNSHAKEQKSFKGLFGLKGDIIIWIDKKNKNTN